MVQGFKKGGKFRPTGKNSGSAVHSSDVLDKNKIRKKLKTNIRIGDTVTVFVSPDEPRRRIKVTKINERYKGKNDTGGIEGYTPDGSLAWARASQIIKINPSLNYKQIKKGYTK